MELKRKRKTFLPCSGCFLHQSRCICHLIPRIETRTRLLLVMHRKESRRTSNSGQLAIKALVNSEMLLRGEKGPALDLSKYLSSDFESYVLSPTEDAIELENLKPSKPVQLIVSDGNWRQASKLNTRHPEIAHLPRVKISSVNTAKYHLRKEHFETGFSTLQAIAMAYQILEGEKVGQQLESLYQAKLAATLSGRGIRV